MVRTLDKATDKQPKETVYYMRVTLIYNMLLPCMHVN